MVAATLALATALVVPAADELPLRVEWTASVGCPSLGSAVASVERVTARRIRVDDAASESLDVRITGDDRGYHLELTLELDDGVTYRELDARRCDTLVRAASLVVAVTLSPLRALVSIPTQEPEQDERPGSAPALGAVVAEPGPSEPPVAMRAAPAPIVGPRTEPSPRRSSSTRVARRGSASSARHGVAIRAAGGLGLGLVPGATVGVQGSLAWRFGHSRLEALGVHWLGRTAPVTVDAGVRVAASGGGVRLCHAPSGGRVEVPLCLTGQALAIRASGRGPDVGSRDVSALWLGGGAGAGVTWWARPRFALSFYAEGLVAARRPRFHLDRGFGRLDAFRSPPVALAVLIAPLVRLP